MLHEGCCSARRAALLLRAGPWGRPIGFALSGTWGLLRRRLLLLLDISRCCDPGSACSLRLPRTPLHFWRLLCPPGAVGSCTRCCLLLLRCLPCFASLPAPPEPRPDPTRHTRAGAGEFESRWRTPSSSHCCHRCSTFSAPSIAAFCRFSVAQPVRGAHSVLIGVCSRLDVLVESSRPIQ